MAKGRKTGGRKKGTPNVITRTVREAFQEAFHAVNQGESALVTWGQANPDKFYLLASKLIPLDITSNNKELSALTWAFGERKVTF